MTLIVGSRGILRVREARGFRVLAQLLLVALFASAVVAPAEAVTEIDTKIVLLTARDALEVRWSTPWVPDIWISGANVNDVDVIKNATGAMVIFNREGEYFLTMGFVGGNEGAKIFLKRTSGDKSDLLGSYIVSGSTAFTLKIKTIVQRPSVVEWQGVLPSLQYFQWVPLDLKRPIKLLIFFAPLMYFGGYTFLELTDRTNELKRKGMVKASLKQVSFRFAKFGAIIGFMVFWIFVVFFL